MDSLEPATLGKKKHAPPYVAYKTFKNFVDSLKITMPGRIDRSVMHTMSGASQSHVMAALHSMELISSHGIPTEAFKKLVGAEGEDRKKALVSAITTGFPFLFDGTIDLSSATGKQLLEQFDKTQLVGNTKRRAIAFFLAAAKDGGISLSPYFEKIQSRSGAPQSKRVSSNGSNTLSEDFVEAENEEDSTPPIKPSVPSRDTKMTGTGESLTVELKSGGAITLTASTSFIKMSLDDRNFVFDLIDRLQKYGATAV